MAGPEPDRNGVLVRSQDTAQRDDLVRTWGPDGRLHAQESVLRRTPPCQHLSLGRPATRMSCEPWSVGGRAWHAGTQVLPGRLHTERKDQGFAKLGPKTAPDSRCEVAGGTHLTWHQRVVIVNDADGL